jgi:uncharacterized membrane protein
LATDIAYWWTADMMWADLSDWLLTVGVIVGFVSVAVALIETFAIHSPLRGRATWRYAIGNVLALILATFDMLVHTRDGWTSVVPRDAIDKTLTMLEQPQDAATTVVGKLN